MLSHALGVTKPKCKRSTNMPQNVQIVGEYLNEKVLCLSKQLIEARKKDPVSSCMFDLERFARMVDPELWDYLSYLTQSAHEAHVQTQSDYHLHVKTFALHTLCA
jgi:hypothetical protein